MFNKLISKIHCLSGASFDLHGGLVRGNYMHPDDQHETGILWRLHQ